MKLRLIDMERARKAPTSRCTDLVPLPRDECLSCGSPVRPESVTEAALLRHGGYGAHRVTTRLLCTNPQCRAVRTAFVTEASPR